MAKISMNENRKEFVTCALDVLGWPWYGAALFTAPGLIFMVSGAVGMALVGLGIMFEGKSQNNNYLRE